MDVDFWKQVSSKTRVYAKPDYDSHKAVDPLDKEAVWLEIGDWLHCVEQFNAKGEDWFRLTDVPHEEQYPETWAPAKAMWLTVTPTEPSTELDDVLDAGLAFLTLALKYVRGK